MCVIGAWTFFKETCVSGPRGGRSSNTQSLRRERKKDLVCSESFCCDCCSFFLRITKGTIQCNTVIVNIFLDKKEVSDQRLLNWWSERRGKCNISPETFCPVKPSSHLHMYSRYCSTHLSRAPSNLPPLLSHERPSQ